MGLWSDYNSHLVGAHRHELDIIRNSAPYFFLRLLCNNRFCILFYRTFCRRRVLYFYLSQSPLQSSSPALCSRCEGKKLTGTLFLVTFGSLITFLPEIVYWGSWASSPEFVLSFSNQLSFNYLMVVITFVEANSLINPIIYAVRMPEVRTSILVIIFRRAQNSINPIDFPLQNL